VIDAHIKLILRSHLTAAPNSYLRRPYLELVFAIDRKEKVKRQPATRPPRQIVTDADRLVSIGRHEDCLRRRRSPYPSERHLADFRRRRQVSLHQRRRQRQGIGVIVTSI